MAPILLHVTIIRGGVKQTPNKSRPRPRPRPSASGSLKRGPYVSTFEIAESTSFHLGKENTFGKV